MKFIIFVKRFFTGIIGLVFVAPTLGSASQEQKKAVNLVPPSSEKTEAKANFSKDELITELSQFNGYYA